MSLRSVASRGEVVRLLGEAEACGRGRAAWARQHGVDPRSLSIWRLNLACRAEAPTALRLVELDPTPPAKQPAGTGVRLRAGALIVEVDADLDAAALQRALTVVAPF
jgi:hypothetical protein